MVEVNEVLYPQQLDTVQNFPSVTEVTESTGEDVNRNRDAIITIERVLGVNPQIGLYTEDPDTATVSQRIGIIENGLANGRFMFRNLNVNNALVVTTDMAGLARVDVGGDINGRMIAPVYIRGPMRVVDSGLTNNELRIDVPVIINARENVIVSRSIAGEPILRITDTNANPNFPERLALLIEGNVLVRNGKLMAEAAIEHSQLRGIDTTPRPGVVAIHVSRGDYHSHKRRRDPATGALLNEVDPNPTEATYGIIDHKDLLNIYTITGQTSFEPAEGVAYHVTNGDGHDHKDGRGAQIDHADLSGVDPTTSDHVTSGDRHTHSARVGDGGSPISHQDLINIGFLSHPEIDQLLNVDFKEHLSMIDPKNASEINTANAALGQHVPQGHVSDPNAHHTRYTDAEALAAEVLIASTTSVYEEGRNTNVSAHIQAIGSGTVSSKNPHGVAAADIGALEGFDPQGNLPDFTKQFLENAIIEILPSLNVPLTDTDSLITGFWTFNNAGGILMQENPSSANTYALTWADAHRLPDAIRHIDNTGTLPYHTAAGIANVPAGTIVATNVQAAINALDGDVQTKEPLLSPSNQVVHTELANDAVEQNNIKNGEVVLAKLAKQYALTSYSFSGVIGSAGPWDQTIRKFGIVVPSGAAGSIVSISVMRHEFVIGATQGLLKVFVNGGAGIVSPPAGFNVLSLGPDVPTNLPFAPTTLAANDQIIIELDGLNGENEYSVVINVKYQHVA